MAGKTNSSHCQNLFCFLIMMRLSSSDSLFNNIRSQTISFFSFLKFFLRFSIIQIEFKLLIKQRTSFSTYVVREPPSLGPNFIYFKGARVNCLGRANKWAFLDKKIPPSLFFVVGTPPHYFILLGTPALTKNWPKIGGLEHYRGGVLW